MNSRKLFAGVASACMALSMFGCSSNNTTKPADDEKPADKTNDNSGTPSGEQLLTVGTTQELEGTFSPIYAETAYDQWVTNMTFQSLLAYTADNEIYAQAAEEVPTADDNSVTFKIRKGLKFSDGKELTSKDVKFTYTLMADPEYIGSRNDGVFNFIEGWEDYQKGDAEEVTGIVCDDDYTVTFKFATPDIDAVNTIGSTGIMEEGQFEYSKGNMGEWKTEKTHVNGSGPYVLNEYSKATGASVVRNENYGGEGDYKIESVIIRTIGTGQEVTELETGGIDYLPEEIQTDVIGPASLLEGVETEHYFRPAEGYVGFNCADGPTADAAVRQALAYTINRQEFVDGYYQFPEAAESIADVSTGYVPTAFWSPVGEGLGQYTVGDAELEGLVNYEFDLEKAKSILDEAGWKPGADGIREKDGQKLEIKFLLSEGNSVLEFLVPIVSKAWKELGVDLKQNTVDFNTLIATVGLDNGDENLSDWSCFFMATSFTGLSNTSMNDLIGYTGTDSDPTYGGSNYVRIIDKELNDYLKAGKQTTNVEESEAAYKKAMIRESELVPYLPIYGNNLFNIFNSKVKNLKCGTVCNWSQALDGAYIDDSAAE